MSRDWYVDAFGSPIADVRAKLIDEAWFGRRVPETRSPGNLGWTREDDHKPAHSPEPDREQDHGIDR